MNANTKPDEKNAENEEEKISPPANEEKRDYYYDDAHGYEVYVDEEDDRQQSENPNSEI